MSIPGNLLVPDHVGVLVLCALNYMFFYYVNFGYWGLGNSHMEHGIAEDCSTVNPSLEFLVDHPSALERVVFPQMALLRA